MRKSDDLKAEYLLIQGQYEAFDQRALSMKALATPLLGAGIAFGVKEHSQSVLLATILVASSLWVLEGIWKGFQYSLTDRIILLEAWFRKPRTDATSEKTSRPFRSTPRGARSMGVSGSGTS